jgi:hypothetical protein
MLRDVKVLLPFPEEEPEPLRDILLEFRLCQLTVRIFGFKEPRFP